MPDIIQLLPDHVANQIAAGEVIQRPASAVKELMENAVDAGAKNIQLIIKDGGRSLIQVIDNGSGMSGLDARLSFSRHATSKIRKADDLWALRTMGFRGEALASVAAVAQVEMRTRQNGEELGTHIIIEGSEVKKQEPTACPEGTSVAIKNLFFNVPARRNFLKSNPVETKHIIDEFQRVALAYPGVGFSFINNDQETCRLMPGTFKQRIVGVFGSGWNERIVSVNEETTVVQISGFIGKPEYSRKTRGEQFFFINNRFIKNSYLHHAVQAAFTDLIASDTFPAYFLRLQVDPKTIDINIHPTKTEIKFEDESSVYAILRSGIRRAIGTFSLSPSLNFENEPAFDILSTRSREINPPGIFINPDYNPFSKSASGPDAVQSIGQARWEQLAGKPAISANQSDFSTDISRPSNTSDELPEKTVPWLLHGRYICTHVKSGLMLIDQQGARERILYERFMKNAGHSGQSQQLLFPVAREFSAPDFELLQALRNEFHSLGFDFEPFGKNTVKINGVPPEVQDTDIKTLFDQLLEQFKTSQQDLRLHRLDNLAKTLSSNAARFISRSLGPEQMTVIIEQLFACETPGYSPSGKPVVSIVGLDELGTRFGR